MVSRFERFSYIISSIYHLIQKIERVEMAKYGLKGPHAQCLLALRRFPEGVTAARLSEICDKDKAAISRTLSELEAAELIARREPEGKRYRAVITLTPKGGEIAQRVTAIAYQAVKQAAAGYDSPQRETFIMVLEMIGENLQAICRDGLNNEENPMEEV